ncbi:hypothetical protein JCM5296_007160 [Sporobolomyces johnsonii]
MLASDPRPSPSDRDPFLPTHHASRSPRSQRFTARRGRVLVLFALPALALVLYVALRDGDVASGMNAGVRGQWSREAVAQRLDDGWRGIKHGWSSANGWRWRDPPTNDEESTTESIGEEQVEDDGRIRIDMLPSRKPPPPYDPNERFLGYLPHSGFHNQRSELQNALFLGALLNRTVLIPPVWIGWPEGLQFYDELQETWTNRVLMHPLSFNLTNSTDLASSPLSQPAHYPSTADEFPSPSDISPEERLARLAAARATKAAYWTSLGYSLSPEGYPVHTNVTAAECKSFSPECRWTYEDSWLAWEKVVDLESVVRTGIVRVRDRWDMRERAVEELLGVKPEDVLVFADAERYDFQFVDHVISSRSPARPLITPSGKTTNHFLRTVSIPAMRRLPQKLVLIGSLFGHQRIQSDLRASPPSPPTPPKKLKGNSILAFIQSSLPFSSPHILDPARSIRDKLGGSEGYIGVHARVGDGVFVQKAQENMEEIWRRAAEKVGVDEGVREEVFRKAQEEERGERQRRALAEGDKQEGPSDWSLLDDEFEEGVSEAAPPSDSLLSRSPRRRKLRRAPASTPSASTLTCRSPLHTSPALLPFNTRLYLATDSRSPLTDPHLALFFATFPCTFLLSDFADDEGVKRMKGLVNKVDGVGLGRLLVPFLEATVASMGRETVGTRGSTFSAYAETTLHDTFVTKAGLI